MIVPLRGSLSLDADACTSCMLCVRECPAWCITLEARKEVDESATPANDRKARSKHVLESFDVDYGLCMFCGVCVEVCPFDALSWNAEPPAGWGGDDSQQSLMP